MALSRFSSSCEILYFARNLAWPDPTPVSSVTLKTYSLELHELTRPNSETRLLPADEAVNPLMHLN